MSHHRLVHKLLKIEEKEEQLCHQKIAKYSYPVAQKMKNNTHKLRKTVKCTMNSGVKTEAETAKKEQTTVRTITTTDRTQKEKDEKI